MKGLKILLKIIIGLVVLALLYVGGVILYAWLTDYRPQPVVKVDVIGDSSRVEVDTSTLSLIIWNIGYAGLGKESDFFYDGGKMVVPKREWVEENLAGIESFLKDRLPETDFFLLQEVDRRSGRSYRIDQAERFDELLAPHDYVRAFGKNYDVQFVPVPFTNPLGRVQSGVATYGRYQPLSAVRHNFEGNYSFPNYLFFLDRCFLVTRYQLNDSTDRQLVVVNTHNSAYDDGSLKKRQMQQLADFLTEAYDQGHYVIVGGDWNQYPAGYAGLPGFAPDTGASRLTVPETYPGADWRWVYDPAIATNRSLLTPYDATTSEQKIIDFYLVSPNVEVLNVQGYDLDFQFSDHQPVGLRVRLR